MAFICHIRRPYSGVYHHGSPERSSTLNKFEHGIRGIMARIVTTFFILNDSNTEAWHFTPKFFKSRQITQQLTKGVSQVQVQVTKPASSLNAIFELKIIFS